jgi:DNA-binding NtrC family response regulator
VPKQILIAEDEPNLRRVLAAQLQRDGHEVLLAEDGQQAVALLGEHHVDVIISDLRMPKLDGMGLLKHVQQHEPGIPVILITAHGTVETAVEGLGQVVERAELKAIVDKAGKTRDLGLNEAAVVPKDRVLDGATGRYRLIGREPPMLEVYGIIEKVADTPSTVLITGESGTGKELVARALHEASGRRDKPLIRVNCAAIPRDLIESELFGYEKGAFTGAVGSKPGRFELAHGGTLFLDEIGEIPVNGQVKLLRAIQEHEFERVGGIKTIGVDVRLVAATNRDLVEDIKESRFREDLYYRINVVQIRMSPLRERRGDIPLLVSHFVERFRERLGKKQVQGVSDAAMELLLAHGWPGNIRELENVIERCTLFCDGDRIEVDDLPPELQKRSASAPGTVSTPAATPADASAGASAGEAATGPEPASPSSPSDVGLKELVREAAAKVERELIQRALQQNGHNVTHTARLLKISRKSLQTKMKELGLREPKEE